MASNPGVALAVAPAISQHEAAQARSLGRARRRATGLLLFVAVGFIASFWLPDRTWAGYVRASLEAGLVGGLADWFAVVALFRHPLGIPIPHTAVIPKSKDGIGTNLAAFVRDNFLAPETVTERLADPAHLDRLGAWLAKPEHGDKVAVRVAAFAEAALDGLDEPAMIDRIVAGLRSRVDQIPIATLAGQAMQEAVRNGRHVVLVDATLEGLRAGMVRNRGPLRQRLGRESPAWVPEFVDDLVFDRADEVVRRFLADVAADPDHDIRKLLDEQLVALGGRLREEGVLRDRVESIVQDTLDDEQLRIWVTGWVAELRRSVNEAADPEHHGGGLRRFAVEAVGQFAGRLQTDEVLRGRMLASLRSAAPRLAQTGQEEIGGIISGTIDRWDAEETATRLETWMGPDLQFVRINGTVVGALVGVVLHALSVLLG